MTKYKLEDIETLPQTQLSLAIDQGESVDYLWGVRARIHARDDITDGQRAFYDIVIANKTNAMLFDSTVPLNKYQSEPR